MVEENRKPMEKGTNSGINLGKGDEQNANQGYIGIYIMIIK